MDDPTSRVLYPTIGSYCSDADRLHFRRNKQRAVELNPEDKHWETCMYTSFFKREPRTNSNLPEFEKQSLKINVEGKQRETCMYTSFFKREPRTGNVYIYLKYAYNSQDVER